MAATSLLALIDDISSVLDDVAVLTKLATKKTAGVLGDDLALNAQQVAGVRAERELPVVWAVAKGSLVNKAILVPAALAISAFVPWAVTPLLMIGGLYLCFEGFEKLAHKWSTRASDDAAHHEQLRSALADPTVDIVAAEKEKIKGAVRTDFILSAEIVTITLGTVSTQPFTTQVAVLVGIALLMTVGVYGLVAGIVKLDDAGIHLTERRGDSGFARLQRALGVGIIAASPYLMKTLSIAGTAAMFLVGGGILTHGITVIHEGIEALAHGTAALRGFGALLEHLTPLLLNGAAGIVAGGIAFAVMKLIERLRGNKAPSSARIS